MKPTFQYFVLQRGDVPSENTLHVCDTEDQRNVLTQTLIFGEPVSGLDEQDMWAKYAEELRDSGSVEFEGDLGLEWFTAFLQVTPPAHSAPCSGVTAEELLNTVKLIDSVTSDAPASPPIHRITAEEFASPQNLPWPAWYFIPSSAFWGDDEWVKRTKPFNRLAVLACTHYAPDAATPPRETLVK